MLNPYREIMETAAQEGSAAQRRIRQALLSLMREQPLDQIRVKEICSAAETARSTFYVYYSNIHEVLEEEENLLIRKMIQQGTFSGEGKEKGQDSSGQTGMGFLAWSREFAIRIWSCCTQERTAWEVLLSRQTDSQFDQKLETGLEYILWEHFYSGSEGEHPEANLVLSMVSALIIRALRYELLEVSPGSSQQVHPVDAVCEALDFVEKKSEKVIPKCRVLRT